LQYYVSCHWKQAECFQWQDVCSQLRHGDFFVINGKCRMNDEKKKQFNKAFAPIFLDQHLNHISADGIGSTPAIGVDKCTKEFRI
jgi:hypothetical protein